eukprot:PITA_03327
MAGGGSRGAPCGACKFLRRKCVKGCVFAPYFCSDEMGSPQFGAIHKVFGASNFSKMLIQLPIYQRYDAVVSVLYEAEARLQDPVYGCVAHIYALEQQVTNLKATLAVGYAQLAACSSSEAVSPSPEYVYDKQSEISSLTYNCNNNSPSDNGYLNPWADHQQIRSDNVTINNYNEEVTEDEGSWSNSSLWDMDWGIHPVSTSLETDLSEQTRPNNRQDGHLEDLVLAVLRRNR